eukprot:EG_transcript_52889
MLLLSELTFDVALTEGQIRPMNEEQVNKKYQNLLANPPVVAVRVVVWQRQANGVLPFFFNLRFGAKEVFWICSVFMIWHHICAVAQICDLTLLFTIFFFASVHQYVVLSGQHIVKALLRRAEDYA